MRTNLRPSARAIDCPSEVLPTPGGPTKQRIWPETSLRSFATARCSMIRSLTFSRSKWSLSSTPARVVEVEVVLGDVLPRERRGSTRGRCGSRRTRPRPAAAARAARARARPPSRTSSGSVSASSRSRSSFDLGLLGVALAELVPGSPSAAGAGSTRAGPSPSPTAPATGSSSRARTPRASRERIAEIWRSRCSTSTVSRSSWRSSVGIVRSVEATRCASALGSSMFAAASCSSSGRYGASPMICANSPWTLRVSASTSGVSTFTSGSASNSPTRYGSSEMCSAMRDRGAGRRRGCAASRRAP